MSSRIAWTIHPYGRSWSPSYIVVWHLLTELCKQESSNSLFTKTNSESRPKVFQKSSKVFDSHAVDDDNDADHRTYDGEIQNEEDNDDDDDGGDDGDAGNDNDDKQVVAQHLFSFSLRKPVKFKR